MPAISVTPNIRYPLLGQSSTWEKEEARGLWGLCEVFAYKVPPRHSGTWLEPAPACSHSQRLLMLSVIAFGKNQAVNQRGGEKVSGIKIQSVFNYARLLGPENKYNLNPNTNQAALEKNISCKYTVTSSSKKEICNKATKK